MAGDDFEAFKGHATVALWIERTGAISSLRPSQEWEKRLTYLKGFCDSQETDPDTLIQESLADNKTKNDHVRAMKRWVSNLPGSDRDRHEAENMLRHFFMKNGMRMMVKPFADVYKKRL